jgi:hypothetical protein
MPQIKHHKVAPGMPLSSYDINIVFAEAIHDCLTALTTQLPSQTAATKGPIDFMNEITEHEILISFVTDTTYNAEDEYTADWRLV